MHKYLGGVELGLPSVVHNQDVARVHDGVQPVSHSDRRAILEFAPHGALDLLVSVDVYSGSGFVHQDDVALAQKRPRDDNELPATSEASRKGGGVYDVRTVLAAGFRLEFAALLFSPLPHRKVAPVLLHPVVEARNPLPAGLAHQTDPAKSEARSKGGGFYGVRNEDDEPTEVSA